MTKYGEQTLSIVMRKGEHPTAEQIFLEMKANNPKIAQGTVYNNLNSLVNEGCIVHGKTENSILSNGVYVGKNSIVKDSVIMPNVKIGDNVVIERAIINIIFGTNNKLRRVFI